MGNVTREKFATKFGVMMAMAGSAIGLGNMWRFPYLTAENGGAAFIVIYLFLMFAVSIPTMITEYIIGRRTHANAVSAMTILGFPKLKFIGLIAVFSAICILGFYCVVGGWAVKYLVDSVLFKFDSPTADYSDIFNGFITSPLRPLIYTIIFLALTAFVTKGGVRSGIEKFSKIIMSLLFVIIILMAIRSVTLPGASEGLKYLLVPDFSKINGDAIRNALGQSFFTLGLGSGTILIYGSYVSDKENLTNTAYLTSILDTVFAIVAGIAIIPAVFAVAATNGIAPEINAGPGLVFITLPNIFSSMPMGQIIAILFFIALLFAALTSSVSMFESLNAFYMESRGLKRSKAVLRSYIICIIPGIICSLSQGILSNIKIIGLNIFDFLDKLSANVLMTSACLLLLIFTGWIMKKDDVMDELSSHGSIKAPRWVLNTVYALIKYVAPAGILAMIITTILL